MLGRVGEEIPLLLIHRRSAVGQVPEVVALAPFELIGTDAYGALLEDAVVVGGVHSEDEQLLRR